MFRQFGIWWKAAAGCAICVSLVAGVLEDSRHWITATVAARFFPPGPSVETCYSDYLAANPRPGAGVYHIVLTAPLGDGDHGQFQLIDRTLRRLYGEDLDAVIQVESIDCPPLLPDQGLAGRRMAVARQRGADLLRAAQADVVIWGEVLQTGQALQLRFLDATTESNADYEVNQITLARNFAEDLGAVIAAKALLRTTVSDDEQGDFLARRMRRALEITGPLAETMPEGLTADTRGDILTAHASALFFAGAESGDNDLLERSIRFYRDALDEFTRDRTPLAWAQTQSDLGTALRVLGSREPGTERLEQSVQAHRDALSEMTRERLPQTWAMIQSNLGNALNSLGERERGIARFEEAVIALQAALEVSTRDTAPLAWAIAQNSLGIALLSIGERGSDPARLLEAEAAFGAALQVFSPEEAKLYWAAAQLNLGNTLYFLGLNDPDGKELEGSVAAYRKALQVFTRAEVPLDWARVQNGLGTALRAVGEREPGNERLQEAVAAYDAALSELRQDRVPLEWAMSFGNQGGALLLMADRTNDAALAARAADQLQQAEAALRAGGHLPFADLFAGQIVLAEAVRARLQAAQP